MGPFTVPGDGLALFPYRRAVVAGDDDVKFCRVEERRVGRCADIGG